MCRVVINITYFRIIFCMNADKITTRRIFCRFQMRARAALQRPRAAVCTSLSQRFCHCVLARLSSLVTFFMFPLVSSSLCMEITAKIGQGAVVVGSRSETSKD